MKVFSSERPQSKICTRTPRKRSSWEALRRGNLASSKPKAMELPIHFCGAGTQRQATASRTSRKRISQRTNSAYSWRCRDAGSGAADCRGDEDKQAFTSRHRRDGYKADTATKCRGSSCASRAKAGLEHPARRGSCLQTRGPSNSQMGAITHGTTTAADAGKLRRSTPPSQGVSARSNMHNYKRHALGEAWGTSGGPSRFGTPQEGGRRLGLEAKPGGVVKGCGRTGPHGARMWTTSAATLSN